MSNYAIDTCAAAIRNPMGEHEYREIRISKSRIFDGVFVEWLGFSFTCAYGRKVINLETIGM